nr:hypothetical protein [Tanacetum cinerariifolium]
EVSSQSIEIPTEEGVPTTSNDPLPSEAKTAQAKEIDSLKKRVKKIELKRKLRASGLKRLRKVRIASRIESLTEASLGHREDASKHEGMNDSIDQEVEITLVDETQGRMNEEDMFDVNDLDGDEVIVDVTAVTTASIEVTTATTTLQISKDELTLAQTLIEIKIAKPKAITTVAGTRPKAKGIVMQEPINDNEKAEEGSSKRAGSNLEQEDVKRQMLEKENESAKLKRCMEIILEDDDDVKIKATSLYSKSTTIVDYKIYKKGKKSYFKIIRADVSAAGIQGYYCLQQKLMLQVQELQLLIELQLLDG